MGRRGEDIQRRETICLPRTVTGSLAACREDKVKTDVTIIRLAAPHAREALETLNNVVVEVLQAKATSVQHTVTLRSIRDEERYS
ncbi:hypothetical protein J6590_067950 [Homalodisca vitripennis]|nr:hypothetical protein J6590_067950 [Homalodisca vitripennis]